MITTASAKPTWARAGVSTRSPAANTPGSPVRMYSSTSTKPRSSTSTFVPSRPRLSDSGRRPTETTTASTVMSSLPSPKWTTVADPSSSGVWPVTITPVRTSMPRLLNDRSTTSATSLSQPGRIFGSASRTVTWYPRSDSIEANSQPMAPPPITTADEGSFSRSSTSSEVRTRSPVDLEAGDASGAPSRTPG